MLRVQKKKVRREGAGETFRLYLHSDSLEVGVSACRSMALTQSPAMREGSRGEGCQGGKESSQAAVSLAGTATAANTAPVLGFGVAFNELVHPLKDWESLMAVVECLDQYPHTLPERTRWQYITAVVNASRPSGGDYSVDDIKFAGSRLEKRYGAGVLSSIILCLW